MIIWWRIKHKRKYFWRRKNMSGGSGEPATHTPADLRFRWSGADGRGDHEQRRDGRRWSSWRSGPVARRRGEGSLARRAVARVDVGAAVAAGAGAAATAGGGRGGRDGGGGGRGGGSGRWMYAEAAASDGHATTVLWGRSAVLLGMGGDLVLRGWPVRRLGRHDLWGRSG